MNTNPKAKAVLCYGDSNTYGTKPSLTGRYVADERWTGLLQQQLGSDYYVEEGLGGRTTDLDHPIPGKPMRNGFAYFQGCLESYMLLDVIIVMLGTNDLKTVYKRSAEDVAQALRQFPEYVSKYCASRNIQPPKIVLVSPAPMDEHASKFIESMPAPVYYDEVSAQKSRQLAEPFKKIAQETGCVFFDAAPVAKAGDDGCHLTKESHKNLADSLTQIIKDL